MSNKVKILIGIIVVVVVLIIPLIKIGVGLYKSGAYGIMVSGKKYGKLETIRLLDNEITSLYGKCGVSDVFGGDSYKMNEDGANGESIVVYYKNPISQDIRDRYKVYLEDEGFTTLESDKMVCVKNYDNNTFMFILVTGAQVKYTAAYGNYEDYIDMFEL